MSSIFGIDRYIAPVTVTDTNNVLQISQNGGVTLELTPRQYWLHDDPNGENVFNCDGVAMVGLYHAIRDALSDPLSPYRESLSGAPGTFTFLPSDSAVSPGLGNGIRITSDAVFGLDFSVANSVNGEWFGFGATQDVVNLATFLISAVGVKPCFISRAGICDLASGKTSRPSRTAFASHERALNAIECVWYDDRCRKILYEFVRSAHVFKGRASNLHIANYGGVGIGDDSNAFEHVWAEAARLSDIIIVHNEGDQDLLFTTHPYDIGRIKDARTRSDFANVYRKRQTTGEEYDLEVEWILCATTYEY